VRSRDGPPRLDAFWAVLAGIAVVVLVVAGLLYFAARHHEFVAFEAKRPSYDPEGVFVERVRVFDRVELNIAAEAERPRGDLVTSYLLFAIASAAVLAMLLATARRETGRLRWLFLLVALGTGYLAVDEQFEIHETLGANLLVLADVPGIERPDDLILVSYAIPVVAFFVAFRRELARSRRAAALLAVGVAIYAFAAVADVADLRFENEAEVTAAAVALAGVLTLARDLLSSAAETRAEGT
jgi:lysylphosphatidylglycerol synthetase-like protein (DUF2156 family)